MIVHAIVTGYEPKYRLILSNTLHAFSPHLFLPINSYHTTTEMFAIAVSITRFEQNTPAISSATKHYHYLQSSTFSVFSFDHTCYKLPPKLIHEISIIFILHTNSYSTSELNTSHSITLATNCHLNWFTKSLSYSFYIRIPIPHQNLVLLIRSHLLQIAT
jgi:hypothetical protein